MSFIEFNPKRFDPETDGSCDVPTSVTRQAWSILAAFGRVEEVDVDVSDYGLTYVAMSTDTIDPLKKGRLLYFDQIPIVDDEPVVEQGLFAMKIISPVDNNLEGQIIFRSEVHPDGPAVFYGDMTDESKVTDDAELMKLSIKLQQIQDAYWCVATELHDSLLRHFPVTSGVLAVEAFLESLGE